MLLGRVLVQVGQAEYLIQVDIQKRANLVDQLQVIDGVHGHVVTSVIADATS